VRSVVIPSRAGLSVNAFGDGLNNTRGVTVPGLGRWPANVILDAEASAALDLQSGESRSRARTGKRAGRDNGLKFGMAQQVEVRMGHSDSGGASRFFYCAKASKGERNAGLDAMTPTKVNDGRKTAIDNPFQRGETPRLNTHPTVKPIKLIEYLAKLILPPERNAPRRLLIPFSGSGSEMLGARKAGWDEITGIEINREYVAIAAARLKAA
jgi:hypothetical protein